MLALVPFGAAAMIYINAVNTFVQAAVPDRHMQGPVMGLYWMLVYLLTPATAAGLGLIGALLGGAAPIVVGGVGVVAVTALVGRALRRELGSEFAPWRWLAGLLTTRSALVVIAAVVALLLFGAAPAAGAALSQGAGAGPPVVVVVALVVALATALVVAVRRLMTVTSPGRDGGCAATQESREDDLRTDSGDGG